MSIPRAVFPLLVVGMLALLGAAPALADRGQLAPGQTFCSEGIQAVAPLAAIIEGTSSPAAIRWSIQEDDAASFPSPAEIFAETGTRVNGATGTELRQWYRGCATNTSSVTVDFELQFFLEGPLS